MINEMIGIDTLVQIKCQVSPRPTFGSLYCQPEVNCDAKVWGTFGLVSTSLYPARLQYLFITPLPFL
jgi:hypothetical protein